MSPAKPSVLTTQSTALEIGPRFTDLRLSVETLPNNWVGHNDLVIHALFQCLETSSCGQNQTKVVLLGYSGFLDEIQESHDGREVVWARSTVRALKTLGYTYIYTPNNERTLQLYHVFRGLITAIFIEEREIFACFHDPKCILSPSNPSGIPLWKLFAFS
ncbi:Glycosyltransferase family 18 protein [Mycena venus]|uniref:Glycosyltransferase family 18 protein n=1 Tax=Mycena venus TaxID=2733690 RepID=A0A8H6YIB9_9AGAR|nr:Glycosyltransferase family 18 protein [Mycena venus]